MKIKHVVYVASFLLLSFILIFWITGPTPPREELEVNPDGSEITVKLAREYQIDLSKTLWKSNRDRHVKDLLDFMNVATNGIFEFNANKLQEDGYHRYSYSIPGADFKPQIRVRDFVHGDRNGLTTVDLKYRDGESMIEMLEMKATPAAGLNATQKVEQDVHACDVRWSRGTRVFLDYSPEFNTVADVAKLFPDILAVGGVAATTTVKKQSFDVYYWQLSQLDKLPNGLSYKITFTFMYKSLKDAFSGKAEPKKDGEFSIRLYAANNGRSRHFDEEHLRIVNDLYEELIWSDWNVDPEMDCLQDDAKDPNELEIWRLPVP